MHYQISDTFISYHPKKNKIKKVKQCPKKIKKKKVSSKIKVPSIYILSSTNLITTSSPGFEDFPRMPSSNRATARPAESIMIL